MASNLEKYHPSVGASLIGLRGANKPSQLNLRNEIMLAAHLNIGNVLGFVGLGVSQAYNYSSYNDILKKLVQFTLDESKKPIPTAAVRSYKRKILEAYLRSAGASSSIIDITSTDKILLITDLCAQAFEELGHHDVFKKKLVKLVKGKQKNCKKACNKSKKACKKCKKAHKKRKIDGKDLLSLVHDKLDISRFVTTNYDQNIERFFAKHLKKQKSDVSHSISVDHSEALTLFSSKVPRFKEGAFHIHGRIDEDLENLVVSERDYQRAYFQSDPESRERLASINMMFQSNATLFLGVGLQEPDVLAPLRRLTSRADLKARQHPTFALLPRELPHKSEPGERKKSKLEAEESRRFLYSRYGVKVIFYDVERKKNGKIKSNAYTEGVENWIKRFSKEREEWYTTWLAKPTIREPRTTSTKPGAARGNTIHGYPGLKTKRQLEKTEPSKFAESILDSLNRVDVILGRTGSGKGTVARQVAVEANKRGKKAFLVSLHGCTDFASTLEAIFRELKDDNNRDDEIPPLTGGLFEKLADPDVVVVLTGLERVLSYSPKDMAEFEQGPEKDLQHAPLPSGPALYPDARIFLSQIVEFASNGGATGKLVLTSSIWPQEFNETAVCSHRLDTQLVVPRLFEDKARAKKIHPGLHRELKSLGYCLAGHTYGMSLVEHHTLPSKRTRRRDKRLKIKQDSGANKKKWVHSIWQDLARSSARRRAESVCEHVLKHPRYRGLPLEVLRRLSQIALPVSRQVINTICDVHFIKTKNGEKKDSLTEVLEVLKDQNLVLTYHYEDAPQYILHPVVRRFFLYRLGSLPDAPGEPHRLDMTDFYSVNADIPFHTEEGHKLAGITVDRLLDELEVMGRDIKTLHRKSKTLKRYRDLCRAAFGLIRNCWTATGMGRQKLARETRHGFSDNDQMNAYKLRLVRLINALKRPRKSTWLAPQKRKWPRGKWSALYIEELAWLYNEVGLVCYCQGNMHEAESLFRILHEYAKLTETKPTSHGYHWIKSQINLAEAQVARGVLGRAEENLQRAWRVTQRLDGAGLLGIRINGLLGHIKFLTGRHDLAREQLQESIEELKNTNHARCLSVFHRWLAELALRNDDAEGAEQSVFSSRSIAISKHHLDLEAYSQIVEAKILSHNDKKDLALARLDGALVFSRQVGLPKLELEARLVQASVCIDLGQYTQSRELVLRCLTLAHSNGLMLGKIDALVLLGRVNFVKDKTDVAREVLKSAILLAQQHNYDVHLKSDEWEFMQDTSVLAV